MSVFSIIKKISLNDKFSFIATKYATYLIYFIISIVVANKLGLFYFGIYGFYKLLLQYFTYSNLGVNYSGIVLMSEQIERNRNKDNKLVVSSILISIVAFIIFFLLFFFISILWFAEIYDKYLIHQYLAFTFFVVIFKQINQIFINTNRVYNKLKIINWAYLIPCFGELLALFLGKEESLFINICWAMVISNGLVTFIFILANAFPLRIVWDLSTIKQLINRGFMLLLYNVSFYFIILIAKGYISGHFNVEQFAQYSFSYNISDAVMLLNNSISFLVYPTLINNLCKCKSSEERIGVMYNIQEKYMLVANLIIIIAYALIPVLHFIVPEYNKAADILAVLLLSQLLVANTFTLTTNLVQAKAELKLIALGVLSIVVVLFSSWLFSTLSENLVVVSYALVIAMFGYNLGAALLTKKSLKIRNKGLINMINPIYFFPIIVAQISRTFFDHYISTILFIIATMLLLSKSYIKLIRSYSHAR